MDLEFLRKLREEIAFSSSSKLADRILQDIALARERGADLIVCGHTHMQFARDVGDVHVVNAGSVGMPFGEAGAYWVLLGPNGVELRRTVYDTAAAARSGTARRRRR